MNDGDRTLPRFTVVSGGQTGVDRAALDAAQALGVAVGGWCPRGRRAADGVIPGHYPLVETASRDYSVRTEWNVRDCDATLILAVGPLTGGTRLTTELARRYQRPLLIFDVRDRTDHRPVREWLQRHRVRVLNVAGPREEECPGCYYLARAFMQRLLSGRRL